MPARGVLRARLSPIDIGVVVAVLVLLYVVVRVGHGATASFSPHALQNVSTNPARLPYDAVRSLLRMFVALFFSFAFTLIYGYTAARSRRAERVLVPVLDILQSVPVLGFLTITVTVFVGLFPIIDSMTILDFASVEAGHLVLTDTGKQFAGADIQQSKAIFREVVLQRVPLVRRIERALGHSTDGTLREGFFLDLLHNHYSDAESRAQLDTAIDWARYAELFEYDAAHGEIRLDQPVPESVTN